MLTSRLFNIWLWTAALVSFALVGAPGAVSAQQATGEPVTIGVSGPLTGQNAQYGAQWKKGFDLALEEINAKGGVKGRPLTICFEDSQADPRQSVAIAQKFVSDPKIVVEVGDFSSTASMAASPIYQRAQARAVRLHQFAPEFHQGRRLSCGAIRSARLTSSRGSRNTRPIWASSAWPCSISIRIGGGPPEDLRRGRAEGYGIAVVATEGYQPDEKDFRSTLVRVRDAKPDGLVADLVLCRRRADRAADARSSA